MGQRWDDAFRKIDASRREGFKRLSPETADTLAGAYDRARAEGREVVYLYENEPHARCLSTQIRAERLRAALRARGVEVLDATHDELRERLEARGVKVFVDLLGADA